MSDAIAPVAAAEDAAMSGYFDHDADFGVFGRGATVEQAFENAARATFALMWEPRDVARREVIEIAFEEADVELALVREGDRWRGRAWGEPWRDDLPRGTGVKGATLTALAVRPAAGGFEARCVVDV